MTYFYAPTAWSLPKRDIDMTNEPDPAIELAMIERAGATLQ